MEDSSANPEPNAPTESSLINSLLYGLSLPERSARSVSALVGGLANETAARLIPSAFRSSKSYSMFIGQSLDFLIHNVGRVAAEAKPASETQEGVLARQAVGGMLDFASMATLHMSPMMFLAIISDVSYGSNVYLRQLADDLKQQGVLDEQSTIDHVSDLVDALQDTTSRGADAFNAPPVNIEALQQTITETRESLNKIDPTTVFPQRELEKLWKDIESTAAESNASMLDVATTMTMFAMNRVTLASQGALSTITVAGSLVDQHIFRHYGDALITIHQDGLWQTLSTSSEPYLSAIWNNFDHSQTTFTEDLLSGKLISDAWTGVSQWWWGSAAEADDSSSNDTQKE